MRIVVPAARFVLLQHSGWTRLELNLAEEIVICTTDGGERRIVDRPADSESFQNLPQEWKEDRLRDVKR